MDVPQLTDQLRMLSEPDGVYTLRNSSGLSLKVVIKDFRLVNPGSNPLVRSITHMQTTTLLLSIKL